MYGYIFNIWVCLSLILSNKYQILALLQSTLNWNVQFKTCFQPLCLKFLDEMKMEEDCNTTENGSKAATAVLGGTTMVNADNIINVSREFFQDKIKSDGFSKNQLDTGI